MRRRGFVFAAVLVAATACSSDRNRSRTPSSTTTAPPTSQAVVHDPVTVTGAALVDGSPVDSKYVGAVVLKDGLVTPCQAALPPVTQGRYSVSVLDASASSGCGAPGARVALWIFAHDQILYSTNTFAWPADSRSNRFDARYTTAKPTGAVPVIAQFNGEVFGVGDRPLPAGTRVDAYVGNTRCGTASVRASADFTGYVLATVGPDAVSGCTRGAPLTFRINGQPAGRTRATNTPPGLRDPLDLVVAS